MQAATEQRRNKETSSQPLRKQKSKKHLAQKKKKKELCIIGGESEALGFHQETTEESRNDKIGFV